MADNTNSNLLDLEALAPTPMQIKLPNGDTVDVQPPKMQDTLKLSLLGQKMQKLDELSDEEIAKLDDDVDKVIVKMIPQLAEVQLSTPQKLGVITMLAEMSVPASQKDLKEAGIEAKSSDPKAPSA